MELRREAALLTTELVVVIACAIAPLPVPAQIPLLVMAMISFAIRGRTIAERFASDRLRWAVGAITGGAALGIAYFVVAPAIEARTGGMIGWTRYAMVRGKPDVFVQVAVIVAALVAATEIVMRAWILERLRGLVRGRLGLLVAVGVTAAIEAVFVGNGGWSSVGAALISVALSGLYLAGGRSLVAPVAARLTFELGLLAGEAFRLVN